MSNTLEPSPPHFRRAKEHNRIEIERNIRQVWSWADGSPTVGGACFGQNSASPCRTNLFPTNSRMHVLQRMQCLWPTSSATVTASCGNTTPLHPKQKSCWRLIYINASHCRERTLNPGGATASERTCVARGRGGEACCCLICLIRSLMSGLRALMQMMKSIAIEAALPQR